MLNEEWRNIEGYEGLYQVSNYGRVKSLKNNLILKQRVCKGYLYVGIYLYGKVKMKRVHRLVAQAFASNPENKPQVNHKDCNKLNNCVNNLEYMTSSENIKHAFKMGVKTANKTMLGKKGKDNKASKPVYMIDIKTNDIIMKFNSQTEAVEYIKVKSNSKISLCCNKKRNKAYGYKWRYADE